MTESDSSAVARLSGELGYPSTADDVRRQFNEMNKFSHHAVFVAEDKNEILGWIHVFVFPSLSRSPVSELGGLVVDKRYRGRGIGKLLLKSAEEWTKNQGYRTLRFTSRASRKEAHEFYKRQGYEVVKSSLYFSKQLH